jgi:hypothetical protein
MRAVPSPSPEAPPVTMNTLPAMSMVFSVISVDVHVNYDPSIVSAKPFMTWSESVKAA